VTKVRLFVPATLPCTVYKYLFPWQYSIVREAAEARSAYYCTDYRMMRGNGLFKSPMHDQKCMKSCSGLHLDFKLRDPTPRSKPPVSRLSLVRDCLLSAFHVLGTVLSCRQKGCVAGAFASELFMRLHRSSLNLGDDMSRNDPRTLLRSVARNVPL
jgi:hypothetical protein